MLTFDGIASAADAARRQLIIGQTGLPQAVAERLSSFAGTGGSPVDLICLFAEGCYAIHLGNAAALTDQARQVAAGCAVLAESFGFHGMAAEGRGSKIAAVLDGQAIDPAPEPKVEWLPTPPATEPSAPPAAGA